MAKGFGEYDLIILLCVSYVHIYTNIVAVQVKCSTHVNVI